MVTVEARSTLKLYKGWASVVSDQCYFTAELKWNINPSLVGFDKDNGAYNNVREKQYIQPDSGSV